MFLLSCTALPVGQVDRGGFLRAHQDRLALPEPGVALILGYTMEFLPVGRRLLMVGLGREVARLSGMQVNRIRLLALVCSGGIGPGADDDHVVPALGRSAHVLSIDWARLLHIVKTDTKSGQRHCGHDAGSTCENAILPAKAKRPGPHLAEGALRTEASGAAERSRRSRSSCRTGWSW